MLNEHSDLVQKLFSSMELTGNQLDELFHPKSKVMLDEPFEAMAAFVKQSRKLIICGDYDCDGIASTSIAVLLAKKLGIEVGYYLPDRLKDGYGVRASTISMAHEKGYTDVLLIDNGVKSFDEINLIKSYGMGVGIIDHHLITDELSVDALLHPDVLDTYGASMCAAGLVYALCEYMGLADDYMLSLAALATVGDVMPLWGKNREIVRLGVDALERNRFKQFDLLIKRNRYTKYSAKSLAFQIVPKVNSVGRLSDRANVNTCVQYFISSDSRTIEMYAAQMMALNDERKSLGKSYAKTALSLIEEETMNIVVSDSFHEGLLGIVANQILQVTQKPTLVLRRYDDVIKGSARSNTISLDALFGDMDPKFFSAFGGHDFAFGMSLIPEFFEEFKLQCYEKIKTLPSIKIEPKVVSLDTSWISQQALADLRQFEPFGSGFQLPLLKVDLLPNFTVSNINGHGYKYSFTGFPIQEAVFFTDAYSRDEVLNASSLLGSLDLSSTFKVAFYVEDINLDVI